MPDGAGFTVETELEPLWIDADAWDEATLPHRPWIAPGYFLLRAITTMVGQGGVAKSSLVLAWAVALALGKPFGGMKPNAAANCLVYNVEDDLDEQRRRLSAILRGFGATSRDIQDRVVRTGPISTGMLFERNERGHLSPTAAMQRLGGLVEEYGIKIMFVDPLAELHGVEENDNTGMRAIVAAFRHFAEEHNIAVVLIHHTRKGVTAAGDVDAARGASAIIGASRIVLTVTHMTPEEGQAFGLSATAHKHHFRVDAGKSNYAALGDGEWFERVPVLLDSGEMVAAPEPWTPPVDAVTTEVRHTLTVAIERGSQLGPWSPKLEKRPRSIRNAMIDLGIATAEGQRDTLTLLLNDGFEQVLFRDANHKWVTGIRAPSGKPVAQWKDAAGA